MHILESHAVPWMRQWGSGLGFFGEEGMESCHKQFNALARSTTIIADKLKGIKILLERHLLMTVPHPTPRQKKL
ncbi:Hypp5411 [Branchiostoma lanceolatum]|uniref:Hypp5411 protein n=1 Tax=Branchiostoma lanceolatum TaxID=7740 RepID=A0A8K0AEY4_BRALA|nr:Hypp5411 [Branchiostoma lanceolatum]